MRYADAYANHSAPDPTEKYRAYLLKKRASLIIKSVLDRVGALILLVFLSPLMVVIALAVCIDSEGGAFFSQTRLTKGMREFEMYKFRTMRNGSAGGELTLSDDKRITRVGRFLRKSRLDELPQLINILMGDMSFVGPRPEVKSYVDSYDDEMRAVFLVNAGLTSKVSLKFSDEASFLAGGDPDRIYRDIVLPRKVGDELSELMDFSLLNDAKTIFSTLLFPIKGVS